MSDKDKAKPSKSVMGNLPSHAADPDGPPPRRRARDPAPTEAPRRAPRERQGPAEGRAKSAAKAKAKPKASRRRPSREAEGRRRRSRRPPSRAPCARARRRWPPPRRSPRTHAAPPSRRPSPPKGAELVTTAVQATGELAKIGLTLGAPGAQARRLRPPPKP